MAQPQVWGVLNATPDSFSDGGACFDPAAAVEHGLRLAAEGAAVAVWDIDRETVDSAAKRIIEAGRL